MDRRHQVACCAFIALVMAVLFAPSARGADWARFRGPNGAGISPDDQPAPIQWSESANLKWRVEMPGPGLSSPIVVGHRVFVTCWTGYGVDARNPGDPSNLKRRLICIDRQTGKTMWSKAIDAVLPEDPYQGMFTENGYASHTPVSDGERVYVFFGKTGVLAFDLDGNKLWQQSVGKDTDPRGWGSASSLILYKQFVIVTASAESEALVALDRDTGAEVWKQEAAGFAGTWGTPILVDVDDGRKELVLAVPYEIWGVNPENGKLRWYCQSSDSNSMCASVVAHDGIVYAVGGRNGGSIAVRAGGRGDVTKTHVVWRKRDRGRIGTPILHDGRLYWISNRVANCVDAENGQRVYQSRLRSTTGSPASEPSAAGDSRRGRRGRGGQDYSSPVVAAGRIYYWTRSGDGFVYNLGPEFEQLACNRFESDKARFSATPAISNGELFMRSNKYLYCVARSE